MGGPLHKAYRLVILRGGLLEQAEMSGATCQAQPRPLRVVASSHRRCPPYLNLCTIIRHKPYPQQHDYSDLSPRRPVFQANRHEMGRPAARKGAHRARVPRRPDALV